MADMKPQQLGEALSAYLDGELDEIETANVEQLLRDDRSVRDQLAVLQRTVKLARSLPRHGAPDSLAEDIQARFERSDLIGGFGEPIAPDEPRRTPLLAILSTAAVLAFVAGGIWFMAMDAPSDAPSVRLADAGSMSKEALPDVGQSEKGRFADSRMKGRKRELRAKKAAVPEAENVFLASATLEQKLSTGIGIASIRSHSFDNEPVRLRLDSNDTRNGSSVTSRLMSRLKKMGVVDVASVSRMQGADAGKIGSLFYRGSSHQNFSEGGGTQILVRATPSQLNELLGEVSRSGRAASFVKLTSGPLVVQGLVDVRGALTRLGWRGDVAVDPLGALASVLGADQDDSTVSFSFDRAEAAAEQSPVSSTTQLADGSAASGKSNRPMNMSSRRARRAKKLKEQRTDFAPTSSSAPGVEDPESYVTLVIEIASDRSRSSRSPKSRSNLESK